MTGSPGGTRESPRPLTTDERAVLDGLLAHDFPGVVELRMQAAAVSATRGCDCGCGTIALHVSGDMPRSASPSPVPVEGTVVGDAGEPLGGVLLFVERGLLSALEVYPLGDDALPMPSPRGVQWNVPAGGSGRSG